MVLWAEPRFDGARRRWARAARSLVADLHRLFPFDIVLAPADDTPYFRDLVAAMRERSAPFVVLMKEVLRPPYQFDSWAPQIRRHLPVIAEHVCVNSEMNRKYILLTGGTENGTSVTGQPRFDVYAGSRPQPLPAIPTVLFLSYEFDVYLPLELRARLARAGAVRSVASADVAAPPRAGDIDTWLSLRHATLEVLAARAAAGMFRLIVKPRPQMHPDAVALDRRVLVAADPSGRATRLADAGEDTRELILGADVVVGFQTTALLEALVANRRVIYTDWSPGSTKYRSGMMPYWELGEVLRVAQSPDDLASALGEMERLPSGDAGQASGVAERWLGVCDGHATDRVWAVVRRMQQKRGRPRNPTMPVRAWEIVHRWATGLRGLVEGAVWSLLGLIWRRPRVRIFAAQHWRRCRAAWGLGRGGAALLELPLRPAGPVALAIRCVRTT